MLNDNQRACRPHKTHYTLLLYIKDLKYLIIEGLAHIKAKSPYFFTQFLDVTTRLRKRTSNDLHTSGKQPFTPIRELLYYIITYIILFTPYM